MPFMYLDANLLVPTSRYEVQPIIGPHYLKLTPDGRQLVVCVCLPSLPVPLSKHSTHSLQDYFVQAGSISILNTPADYKVQYIDILPNGGLSFNRFIDFQSIFPQYGGAKPHSSVIVDLTNPYYPLWY